MSRVDPVYLVGNKQENFLPFLPPLSPGGDYNSRLLHAIATTEAMDWTRDDRLVSDKDLKNIFKYEPKTTTVAHNLEGDQVGETHAGLSATH